MAKAPIMYKSKRYTGKNVEVLISESLIRFLRVTGNHLFLKEVYKGMQRSLVILMNETKKNIQSMKAVYSGFLRSNIISWMEANPNPAGRIKGFVATRAWYDILIHEGLGIHANPPQKDYPSQYRPTAQQLAIVPTWASKMDLMKGVKRKGAGAGPRPFLRNAVESASIRIVEELGKGAFLGIRNVIASGSQIPRHKLNEIMKFNLG